MKQKVTRIIILTLAVAFVLLALPVDSGTSWRLVPRAEAQPRPNIIVILADDLGYSDLGCYGGEINTPNLDGLAKNGLRFTQFYNSARCCPTRASLLTGLYPHQAGVGMMTADAGAQYPGYRGAIQPHTVTLAEVLKAAGYRTAMSGKCMWATGCRRSSAASMIFTASHAAMEWIRSTRE